MSYSGDTWSTVSTVSSMAGPVLAASGPWGIAAAAGMSLISGYQAKKAAKRAAKQQAGDYHRMAAQALEESKRAADDSREQYLDEVEGDRAQRAATGLFESESAYQRTGAGDVERENIREGQERVGSILDRGRQMAAQYNELARRTIATGKIQGQGALIGGGINALSMGLSAYQSSLRKGDGTTDVTKSSLEDSRGVSRNQQQLGETYTPNRAVNSSRRF